MEEHYLSGMQLAREHYREGDTFRENKNDQKYWETLRRQL